MSVLKYSRDVMFLTNPWYVEDSLPVHLFTAAENSHGAVSCNVEAKLVVVNLTRADDIGQVLSLASIALDEMLALDTGTLIYDIRQNPTVEGSLGDTAVRTAVLESTILTRFAVLAAPDSSGVPAASVQRLLEATKVELYQAHRFADLVRIFQQAGPALARVCSLPRAPDFFANYGGSVFSVPELRATVIRASGIGVNSESFQRLFLSALVTHVRNKASTLIVDTSDSPAATDVGQHESFLRSVVVPMSTLGVASRLVHVHLEELGQTPEAVPFCVVCAECGVFGGEVQSLADAFVLVRALTGLGQVSPQACDTSSY